MAGCAAAGCSSGTTHADDGALIGVDAPTTLADHAVHLRISGLKPHDEITVGSSATAADGKTWHGSAVFAADGRGAVDLATARPSSGTYRTVDGMGLFWSMKPPSGNPDNTDFIVRPPEQRPSYAVRITVTAHGRQVAERTLTREWEAPGVRDKALTLADDKVIGELFLPAPGAPRHPAVLAFGGSEGGLRMRCEAALLASHGYPALALGYFGLPGLPRTLHDVPLEYFATAARLLAAQPGTDPAHLVVMGYSRGSEAALLTAEDFPTVVHGAIVYSPSAQTNGGFPRGGSAWDRNGRPLAPYLPIPLGRLSGPLLAIAGADDALWHSPLFVDEIGTELQMDHNHHAHRMLVYPGAGHGVGTFPYLAGGTHFVDPGTGIVENLGGTRAGNAAAQEKGWPEVLAFLAKAIH